MATKNENDEATEWAEDDGEFRDIDDLEEEDELDVEYKEGGVIDIQDMPLKPDHEIRPLLVTPDKRIFLETFSPVYRQAVEFLIAIAEPERRPLLVHEYRLTRDSLYAAASLGLRAEYIIKILNRLSKTDLPAQVVSHIRRYTERYGKVTMYVKKGKYFLESSDPQALHAILNDDVIAKFRVAETPQDMDDEEDLVVDEKKSSNQREMKVKDEISDDDLLAAADRAELEAALPEDLRNLLDQIEGVEPEKEDINRISFEIRSEGVETIQKRLLENLKYPLLLEYDFANDPIVKSVRLDLKPTCRLRPYQEKSLKKMFNEGRARSGIIVLPCGAGKTLTGVAAASTIKKPVIVLCTSAVAVQQWQREFVRWCDVDPRIVKRFTSSDKSKPPENCILCATYSMLASKANRSEEAKKMINWIKERDWGLMILDEVQTVPAKTFRELLTRIPARCKLGLTATLVREDGKIGDLRFMVGPKLYEANWMDLQEGGYIARVKCLEVWCPMLPRFYEEYCRTPSYRLKLKLCVCNPSKFMAAEFLIRKHEARGDKIIVFSDDIDALKTLSDGLNRKRVYGDTPPKEREAILELYKTRDDFRTIMFSKIADNAFDLPEANVLIQVASQGGGRRQEAQRLGRILRAKANSHTRPGEPNAFFYSLVSKDTKEMSYATARQRFLVDQGYSFQVLTYLKGFEKEAERKPYVFSSDGAQKEMLLKILANDNSNAPRQLGGSTNPTKRSKTSSLIPSSIASHTGAADSVYREQKKSSKPKKALHPLIRQRFAQRRKKQG
eukprot:m.45566 g.45566  ORF g.45566 m.45566 type:complete len:784 (+) comp7228_c0_seq1:37-2388(+)